MRWVENSKLYHHIDVVRLDCGLPFVVGAKMFERTRQRSLQNWVKERKGYLVTIKLPEAEIDEKLIVQELDKDYDTAAAISLINLRIFGNWNGRTGGFATKKNFCLEFAARVWGLAMPWRAKIDDFNF